MTDLIPRDAAIDYAMNVAVFSPRASQSEINAAVLVLARVDTALRAIPAINPAAIRDESMETPAFSRLVEEAKNAVEVLRFAVTEIQDLENTLSSYRQNWANADAAANSLSAAILAVIGEKK